MQINLTKIGLRLGLIISKYPAGIHDAAEIAQVSEFTLNRYLAGTTPGVPLIPLARICIDKNININWLITGEGEQTLSTKTVDKSM
ncbi:MAG: hypothetical protein KAS93_08200 [Gammaproteobacteria bacterium]|nr:hypothetical protein [Gammaproteobacteria bacterium]